MLLSDYFESAPEDWDFIVDIYNRFRRLIFQTAWNLAGQDAEDLAQDVVLRLYRPKTVETLRSMDDSAIAVYIYKTTVTVSLNHLKKQRARYEASCWNNDAVCDVPGDGPSPEEYTLAAERSAEFSRCFRLLCEEDQKLLEGKYFLGLSDAELAVQLNCKPASIRMKLTRARRRAYQLLLEGDVIHGCDKK